MKNCKGCNVYPICPVLNREECPIKAILESKERLIKEAEELMTGRAK
ncbi:hypothetical protein ES703_55919 [subsurface metagenome]